MGKFDSFYVPCPKCGARVEFETQWNREMASLSLENAPSEILFDVMNSPRYCGACGQWMALVDPAYPPGPRGRPNLRAAEVQAPANPPHSRGMKWWPFERPFTYADLKQSSPTTSNSHLLRKMDQ